MGAVDDSHTVDLQLAYRLMLMDRGSTRRSAERLSEALLPTDMVDFIEGEDRTLDAARDAIDWAQTCGGVGAEGERMWYGPGERPHLVPLLNAPLLRDFMGFEEHLRNVFPRLGREIPPEWYAMPVYYKGNPSSVSASGDAIVIPNYADEIDFEFELAAVIGRGGRDISVDDATSHIYGFTIYNDFSAREIQAREMTVGLGPAKGKDFDGAHVFGPHLVTRDEIPDVYVLRMVGRVNDEIWCDSNSGTIHWTFEQMIHHASAGEYLRPGEIFGSGTVGNGSALERGRSLRPGDRIDLEVDRLGVLTNAIRSISPDVVPPPA
ncbi:MAG: fumarylacetoacetate hydrolase family protein [Acidobacteria bacterium]|nr:fumarylacetoacetate hydrolase family protein [Acidobacteriota bacterium]